MYNDRELPRVINSERRARATVRRYTAGSLNLLSKTMLVGILALAAAVNSSKAQVVAPDSTVDGKTMGEWVKDWALWAFTEPEETNPMYDETGEYQHLNQEGPVWFVAGSFGGSEHLSFDVPSDKYLFAPLIFAWDGASFEDFDSETHARELADENDSAFFSVDGFTISEDKLLAEYRAASGEFYYHLPDPSLADPNEGYVAFDGHWVMLEPLPPGEHLLHTGGGASIDNFLGERILTITSVAAGGTLRAGDADQDLDFDQLDLVRVQVAGKYLTAQAASWGEGDWDGAPGDRPGEPPTGNGLFDQLDIIAAAANAAYLTGPYVAVQPNGQSGDGQTSLVYNVDTGELSVDAPAGRELTSINVTSEGGKFVGDKPAVLDGAFDNFAADNLFKATFGGSFGSLSFGRVLPANITESELAADLSAVGSLAGGGDLGNVDLISVPEPACLLLLVIGSANLLLTRKRGVAGLFDFQTAMRSRMRLTWPQTGKTQT